MPEKSNATLIGLIVGGVLLVCCCCAGIGAVALVAYGARKVGAELGAALPKIAQAAMIGRWQTQDGKTTFEFLPDDKLKKNGLDLVYRFSFPDMLEIGPDNAGNNKVNGQPHRVIRYRAMLQGDTMTLVELDPPPGAQPDAWSLQRR